MGRAKKSVQPCPSIALEAVFISRRHGRVPLCPGGGARMFLIYFDFGFNPGLRTPGYESGSTTRYNGKMGRKRIERIEDGMGRDTICISGVTRL